VHVLAPIDEDDGRVAEGDDVARRDLALSGFSAL